jgi:leader peptidase (prepilin peptidase)/N-methyltransferase
MDFVPVLFGLALCAVLAALVRRDLEDMILPDGLNALLALGGLAQAAVLRDPEWLDALAGCALAGAALSAARALYARLRGIDGLGLGDVKLAAAGALWSGVEGVGPMLLAATATAAATMALRAATGAPFDARRPFPFGPFLAIGVIAAWTLNRLAA